MSRYGRLQFSHVGKANPGPSGRASALKRVPSPLILLPDYIFTQKGALLHAPIHHAGVTVIHWSSKIKIHKSSWGELGAPPWKLVWGTSWPADLLCSAQKIEPSCIIHRASTNETPAVRQCTLLKILDIDWVKCLQVSFYDSDLDLGSFLSMLLSPSGPDVGAPDQALAIFIKQQLSCQIINELRSHMPNLLVLGFASFAWHYRYPKRGEARVKLLRAPCMKK